MPYWRAGLLAACLASGLAWLCASSAQDPSADGDAHFWPHRKVGMPVDLSRGPQGVDKPAELQLWYSYARGQFQKGPKLAIDRLDSLQGGKKGINFIAERDGEYEFTVQYIYADGTVSPKSDELRVQQRIVIDTIPPAVRIAARGTGVDWIVTDDNTDPRGISLEVRRAAGGTWAKVPSDRALRPTDSYRWTTVNASDPLEVRVIARDRAGHEGISPIVRVPGDGTAGGGDWVGAAPPRSDGISAPPGTGANLPGPQIAYVNNKKFDLDHTILRAGRSGVKAVHLFVIEEQGDWKQAKGYPLKVSLEAGGKLSLSYEAEKEGLYGFFVIPESGAGKRAEDPRKTDQPMFLVEVDTTPPFVQIQGVDVRPGPARGPLVDITWAVNDRNLMPQPIGLEYSTDKLTWKEIKYQLPPGTYRDGAKGPVYSGRYTWEVPDPALWKFWLRIRATDKATNTGEVMWKDEVIVDLEQPSAGIESVRGGKGPGGAAPPRLPTPTPVPAPKVNPTPAAPIEKGTGVPTVPELP